MALPTKKTPPKNALADTLVLIYGPPKIGKSTFCSHAPDTLFLATEPGLNYLNVFQWQKNDAASPGVTSWEDFLLACAEIAAGGHSFRTIAIDTADNLWKFCVDYILRQQNVKHESELEWGKGYALIRAEFHRALTKLAQLPYGLILTSHSQEKEFDTPTGKQLRIVPTLPDKCAQIVNGLVDMILYCDVHTELVDGKPVSKRVIRTKPTRQYLAGDRGQLPPTIDLSYDAFLSAFNGSSGKGTQPEVKPVETKAADVKAAPPGPATTAATAKK